MIDIEESYRILFATVRPGSTVEMALGDALYRTLAKPIVADLDDPPFDKAVMDGYAVRAADVLEAPIKLRIVGQVAAGDQPRAALQPGMAMQINTGAPIPAGADAVVRVEDTELVGEGAEQVAVRQAAAKGNFITTRGTNVRAGDTVLRPGTLLTPPAIGAAATAGAARVTVYHKPRVVILSTGNELVAIDEKPKGAQIRNSNRFLLEALVQTAHAEVVAVGTVRDDRESLRRSIQEGMRADVLCITGGVSMGAFDYVPEILERCGATFHIRKMAIKPGRPIIFATGPDGCLVFALPGNPASAFVGFELLVRPALAALEGRTGQTPMRMRATLQGEIKAIRNRRTYLPARAWIGDNGAPVVEPLSWQGSGDAFGMARANALIERPPAARAIASGKPVEMLLLQNH